MSASVAPKAPMAQDGVIASIRDRIAHGRLRPGDQVRQQPLAEELGVSVVPVREALNVLQAEGLLVYQPHRGYFVARLDLDELEEAYTIRGLLEDEAIARGVPRLDQTDLRRLDGAIASLRRIDERAPLDLTAFAVVEREFQFVVFHAADMPRLVNLIRVLWDTTGAYRALLLADGTQRHGLLQRHTGALAAAHAGQVDGVLAHLRAERADAVAHFGAIFERRPGARRSREPSVDSPPSEPIDLGVAMLLGPAEGAGPRTRIPPSSVGAQPGQRPLGSADLPEGPIRILLDDGASLSLDAGPTTVRWELRPLVGDVRRGRSRYHAGRSRPHILLLHFADPDEREVMTVLVDMNRHAALLVLSRPLSAVPGSALQQSLLSGALVEVDGPVEPIEESRGLVGARLVHDVVGGGLVEHLYLNSQVVLWQRLGPAASHTNGREGYENAATWAVDDDLYLVASVGRHGSDLVELIDLARGEAVGRVRAERATGSPYTPFTAGVDDLGQTAYPLDYEPA